MENYIKDENFMKNRELFEEEYDKIDVKEIQNQGKDADNYDYKPDWIPYWAKKSHELYKKEIHVKTQDLLKKFDLKSADEPLREDFEHLNRPIEPMRGRGTRLDRTQKFGIFTLFSVLFFRR